MNIALPRIIQGGMGAGVSDWRLARAVSSQGQLGVVSGTALDVILSRRLQNGDPGGHMRRALEQFPFPEMVQRILDRHYIPGGKAPEAPYRRLPMHSLETDRETQEMSIAGNFVEITLARETHTHPVGINYLEKIQCPHLPSLYGALLAGVAVVIVGAGIPLEFPEAMDRLCLHKKAVYPIAVDGPKGHQTVETFFNPQAFIEKDHPLPALVRPDFLPIVSSATLARTLAKRLKGRVSGFIVEHHSAGGHNAPPRGLRSADAHAAPVYGARDEVQLEAVRKLGLPFWLAGGYGSPEGLKAAQAEGAAGVQVGSLFALCKESGLVERARRDLISRILDGTAQVKTDGRASPTGFPFKVADVADSLSRDAVYQQRRRVCDLGFLRTPYVRDDGTIGYRCAAESPEAFQAKGGEPADTVGRKCLCNALVANVGMPQILGDGTSEQCLFTLGDDLSEIRRYCTDESPDYSAADVLRKMLG